MTVPETLKAARAQTGYSMREVAAMIGKSHQVVHFSEKSVYWLSDDGMLLKDLCSLYGIEFEPLFIQLKCEKETAPKPERKRYPR